MPVIGPNPLYAHGEYLVAVQWRGRGGGNVRQERRSERTYSATELDKWHNGQTTGHWLWSARIALLHSV
ncbi:hypothetical protein UPYG_G00212540 [Umbra pygmaea]|uniref:Uncharacterized protein n=1 Tax=Umbra pygmaea TaxID=75934 RepID=A0ABD0X6A6_UMBPY